MSNTCAMCHQKGDGCCFIKGTADYMRIGIFYSDIHKIEEFLQKNLSYFTINETIDSRILEFLVSKVHPIFNTIYYNNNYIALKNNKGRCLFLDDTGCTLPHNTRPIYCRIYPFWPSYNNEYINVLPSNDCLAQAESTMNWRIVNQHFEYTEEYIRGMFDELMVAAELHLGECNSKDN